MLLLDLISASTSRPKAAITRKLQAYLAVNISTCIATARSVLCALVPFLANSHTLSTEHTSKQKRRIDLTSQCVIDSLLTSYKHDQTHVESNFKPGLTPQSASSQRQACVIQPDRPWNSLLHSSVVRTPPKHQAVATAYPVLMKFKPHVAVLTT